MFRELLVGHSVLIHNAIDNNINEFLRPLNLIQSLFLVSSYSIRNNFITHRSPVSKAFNILGTLTIISIYIIRAIYNDYTNVIFVNINTFFDLIYYSLGYALNLYACVSYQDLNIDTVLKIQELYTFQLLTSITLRKLTRLNWLYIVCCCSFCIYENCSLIYLFGVNRFTSYFEVFCQSALLAFDINTIYATQIIEVLKSALKQWLLDVKSATSNKKITTSSKGKGEKMCFCHKIPFLGSSRVMTPCVISCSISKRNLIGAIPINQRHTIETDFKISHLASDEAPNDFFWKDKLTAYATILNTYETTKTAFQFLILYYLAETFIHAIFYVYYAKDFLQAVGDDDSILGALVIVGCIMKNVLTLTILCIEVEYFHKSVNDAMVDSLMQMTNDQCSEQEKQMHKNVVRMSRLSPKFAVCNLFALDATMPRQLLSLIATYTIVMLQFLLL